MLSDRTKRAIITGEEQEETCFGCGNLMSKGVLCSSEISIYDESHDGSSEMFELCELCTKKIVNGILT